GRWAFWPGKAGAKDADGHPRGYRTWQRLAAWLERRPGAIWLGTVLLMLPFAVVALFQGDNLEFDLVKRLPDDAPSSQGGKVLREHFPEGMIGPVMVMIRSSNVNFRQPQGEDLIAEITDRLNQQKDQLDLADVRSLVRPLGTTPAAQDALDELVVQAQLENK